MRAAQDCPSWRPLRKTTESFEPAGGLGLDLCEVMQGMLESHGHGLSSRTERLVCTARGFPKGITEAWSNLYTVFAMAVAARADGREIPVDWLDMSFVQDGAKGVRFIDACARSDQADAAWAGIEAGSKRQL